MPEPDDAQDASTFSDPAVPAGANEGAIPLAVGPPYPPYADTTGWRPAPVGAQGAPSASPAMAPDAGPAMAADPPARPRSGFAWLWWVFGIFALLMVCVFSSVLLVVVDKAGGFDIATDSVAVIPMDGTIAGTGTGPTAITPEGFLKQLERAEKDENVKAIVLRVNSPGGTVAASEEIATYVKNATKPVVVSVGDVDASGAYMVSSQADRIVANPGSAVGSIGVIMEVPNASKLLDKIGLSFKVLTAGKYKDAGSPYRELTPQETAMLQGQIDQVYGQFIDIVASGRKLPRSEVASLATGWAWNGNEAKKLHLVDQIGTYKDAVKAAARLGGITGEYKTEVYETQPFSSLLSTLLGIEAQLKAITANTTLDRSSAGGTTLAK
jgi:protease IV